MSRRAVRFGENLKIIRSKCKMTQAQLAEELCVERQTISAWENNMGKPDVYALAKICELLDISADEVLFGKETEPEIVAHIPSIIFSEQKEYISAIKSKGIYDIIAEDIENFFPIAYIPFSRIMGIAIELKKRGHYITHVYDNGFNIYFPTDEAAGMFSGDIFDIIEEYIHHDENSVAYLYTEKAQAKIDAVEIEILEEVKKELFGDDLAYYWVDKYDRIRGYGRTEEDCKKQATEQGCLEYSILQN